MEGDRLACARRGGSVRQADAFALDALPALSTSHSLVLDRSRHPPGLVEVSRRGARATDALRADEEPFGQKACSEQTNQS